ncbi:hypothetical protein M9458_012696, partial [Cirrhinus mrigala]
LPKTRSYDDLPTSCEGLTPNRRSSDPNLNEKWQDRLLALEISMTKEADGNDTQTTERDGLDQRLGLNTNNSDRSENVVELSGTDSQMQNISQEENGKLDLLNDTPAFDTQEESAQNASNSEDQTSPEKLEEKPASQHPLPTNENSELPPDGLHLDNDTTCNITHDPSESSSQSSLESSSSPNHTAQTLNGVRSPSQDPVCLLSPPSANQDGGCQTSAAGDASPTSPHKHSLGVSGRLAALGHLDKDGLSLHSDAVQAGHQLQVQELWSRLHVNRKL